MNTCEKIVERLIKERFAQFMDELVELRHGGISAESIIDIMSGFGIPRDVADRMLFHDFNGIFK